MGSKGASPYTILVAEDDPDDRFLMQKAFRDLGSDEDLRFVEDGEELIRYLGRVGPYANPTLSPRPALIFLDLNLPRKDGRQVLVEIKSDPALRDIPIVVWTTSGIEEDVSFCRKAGAEVYKTKPASYAAILKAISKIKAEWLPLTD